ncbi:DUF4124 domain-containing protein [Thermomonas sp.]|uniref:DUF4124 domain-containing protein n=1 Tax=Thermomonas sp. TaxID=1971895 RepID=UPI0035ADE713
MDIARPLVAVLVLSLASATALAEQQRVYQWKDANGVTHYTDTLPPQTHKSRDIDDRGTPAEAPKAKVEESRQCLDARANLQRLQGGQAVGIDTDGDGKADRNLTADERASQVELNHAAVKAYCPATR